MECIELAVNGRIWLAELLTSRAATTVARIKDVMPFSGWAIQDEWSRDVALLDEAPKLGLGERDVPIPFQYPGLVMYDPQADALALCFGNSGRWRDGFGPIRAIPIAEVRGGLPELEHWARSLQFDGKQEVRVSEAPLGTVAQPDAPPNGRRLHVTLGDAVATAVLLEDVNPLTVEAFAAALPVRGFATNTVSSGPFTRFWNDKGGPEGCTELHVNVDESPKVLQSDRPRADYPGSSLGCPGFIYYVPAPPWSGIRIAARGATVMSGALPGGRSVNIVPLAQFVDDWSEFRDAAEMLTRTGQLPMSIAIS